VDLPLYSQQLNKDLVMNVYSGGKWGSYRHLLLDSCATVSTPHAWLSIMTPGDLSSFRWLEGHLVPDRYGLALVSRTHDAFIHLGVDCHIFQNFCMEIQEKP
jgi:fatty acid synthase